MPINRVLEEGDGWQRVAPDPTIRRATDADGPAIGKLYNACGMDYESADWTQPGVGAWWWLAEADDGALAGAIRVIPAALFGLISAVLVHPDHRHPLTMRQASSVTSLLFAKAFAALKACGITEVHGIVDEANTAWQAILARYGGGDLGPCRRFARRIA